MNSGGAPAGTASGATPSPGPVGAGLGLAGAAGAAWIGCGDGVCRSTDVCDERRLRGPSRRQHLARRGARESRPACRRRRDAGCSRVRFARRCGDVGWLRVAVSTATPCRSTARGAPTSFPAPTSFSTSAIVVSDTMAARQSARRTDTPALTIVSAGVADQRRPSVAARAVASWLPGDGCAAANTPVGRGRWASAAPPRRLVSGAVKMLVRSTAMARLSTVSATGSPR